MSDRPDPMSETIQAIKQAVEALNLALGRLADDEHAEIEVLAIHNVGRAKPHPIITVEVFKRVE